MKTLSTYRPHFLSLIFIILVIAINTYSYSALKGAYFISDEWKYIGLVRFEGYTALLSEIPWYQLLAGIGRPLGTVIQNIFYLRFPYNPLPFVIFGLLTHSINSILVYVLILKLFRNKYVAFLSGIFFTTSSSYLQALNWVSCMVEIPGSTMFALFSIILILFYVERKKPHMMMGSLLTSYISFLFLDANAFLFILNPLVLHIYQGGKKRLSWFFIIANILIFVLSTIARFGLKRGQYSNTLLLGSQMIIYIKQIFNIFYYPLIGIAQTLIPTRLTIRFSEWYLNFNYGHIIRVVKDTKLLATSLIPDIFLTSISLCIIFVIWTLLRSAKQDKKPIMVMLSFYVLGFAPIAFFLTGRNTAFIESRFMYVPAIGIAAFFGYIVYVIQNYLMTKTHLAEKLVAAMMLILCSVYFYEQMSVTKSEVKGGVYVQQEIRNLTDQLRGYMPNVLDKPIFYVTSDIDFYYHFNNKVPFQEGTGYMLMVLFQDSGKIPDRLVKDQYLIEFGGQGYKEIGDQGFGYYWDKKSLSQLFIDNPQLNTNQIIAFTYLSGEKKIVSTTDNIRKYIAEGIDIK